MLGLTCLWNNHPREITRTMSVLDKAAIVAGGNSSVKSLPSEKRVLVTDSLEKSLTAAHSRKARSALYRALVVTRPVSRLCEIYNHMAIAELLTWGQ